LIKRNRYLGGAGAMHVSYLLAICIFKQLLLCSILIEIKHIYRAYKHLKKYNILHIAGTFSLPI